MLKQSVPQQTDVPENTPSPAGAVSGKETVMPVDCQLRQLTDTEQQVFPGLRWAVRVMKGQLTRTLTAVPQSRAGWVVWLAELYPDCFLLRLPGGASILVTDGNTAWTPAADTVPVTTIAQAAALVQRQRWQAGVLSGLRQSLLLDNVP